MDTDRQLISAKIYRFPATRQTKHRASSTVADVRAATISEAVGVDVGAWYHDAAIEEARLASKK